MDFKRIFGGLSGEQRLDARAALDEAESGTKTDAQAAAQAVATEAASDKAEARSKTEPSAELTGLEKMMGDVLRAVQGMGVRLEALEKRPAEKAGAPNDASTQWASALVTGGTILPAQAESYAAVHRTLSGVEAAAKEAGEEGAVTLLGADGGQQSVLSAFCAFVSLAEINQGEAKQGQARPITQLFAPLTQAAQLNGAKVLSTRAKTEARTADGLEILSDEEIETMATEAFGPIKAKSNGASA